MSAKALAPQWPQALAAAPAGVAAPLVVDLDGTLARTDTLIELGLEALRSDPLNVLRAPFWLLRGKAAFKQSIASRVRFSAKDLPYHAALLDYLRSEMRHGRLIVLATAAPRCVAEAVAAHLGLFDRVLATDGWNLKGVAKLRAIKEAVGGRFVYAGDSAADLPIWKEAEAAILVSAPSAVGRKVRAATPVELELPREPATLRTWLRALRVHQWLKNALLFVPLLTAFSFFEPAKLAAAAAAFLAFSLAASATYVLNDLWDLESDRAHPRKRHRPFAAARIPIRHGLLAAAAALPAALAVAAAVSPGLLAMVLAYLAITSLYSWKLKRCVLLDVLTLSLLYTLRILAGAVAVGVPVSFWLLAFSVFVFLSLALVKRCSELVLLQRNGGTATAGRDYLVSDMAVLWPLGVGSALCAAVVFGLFINDPGTAARYASPALLWFAAVGLLYWLSRLWVKCARGEMDDDPLVFALRDATSRFTLFWMLCATLAARFLEVAR